MAAQVLAHGPWALLHSAELMRTFISDINLALKSQCSQAPDASRLYGTYNARKAKSAHNRPLPLPDALLQGSVNKDDIPCAEKLEWIENVLETPWLWQLQWTTISILALSPEFQALLMSHCPRFVAEKWLKPLHERVFSKMLGASVSDGYPSGTAAMTPLMTVVSEIILLKMTYEL